MITKKYILATIAFVAISAPKIAFGASRKKLGRELLEADQHGDIEPVRRLNDARADLNRANAWGGTPLTYAIYFGCQDTVKMLLNAPKIAFGASREELGPELLKAAEHDDIECVRRLIDAGADVNHANHCGLTPLLFAVHKNQKSVVRILLNEGADVYVEMPDGTSALRMAYERQSNSDLINLLLNHGAFPLSGDEIRSNTCIECPERILQLQTENSEKRCDALKTWCEYIDEEYDVPVVLQRLIVRDMLGANIDYSRGNVEHQWSLGSIASWFRKKMRWTT